MYLFPGFPCPWGFSNPEYNQYKTCTPIDSTPTNPEFPLVISNWYDFFFLIPVYFYCFTKTSICEYKDPITTATNYHSYSPDNSPAGDYLKDGASLPCRYGSSSAAGASVCVFCSPFAANCIIDGNTGAMTVTLCIPNYKLVGRFCLFDSCPANQYSSSGWCMQCLAGYSTAPGNQATSCTSCGVNAASCTISTWGVVTITSCIASYTLSNGQCSLPTTCPANQFLCTGSCSPCLDGEYSPAHNKLKACIKCKTGALTCNSCTALSW